MNIRLCTYNIEYFTRLFNKNNSLKDGAKETARLKAIETVLKKLDADIIGILEAPNSAATGKESTVDKLENFAKHATLRTTKALIGYKSSGVQEIALLYDPQKFNIIHDPGGSINSKTNPRFKDQFLCDTDEDRIKEVYRHYRPPLEAKVEVTGTETRFMLMVAHPKSKGIFDSMDLIHWERESKRNRLKLFAECESIRNRIDSWIKGGLDVVAMGDFNDGPGMDFYEFKWGKSAVEIVIGNLFEPELILRSLAGLPAWKYKGWIPSTARFKDRFTEDYVNVLIDHILVSSGIKYVPGTYRIWNPFDDESLEPMEDVFVTSSDHFPVTLDILVK